MILFYLKDILEQKKIYLILLVVLVLISSTTNLLLVYFYQKVNLDDEKNKYYNIYTIYVGESASNDYEELIKHIEKNIKCKIIGSFEVGTLEVNGEKFNCANYSYSNVGKFYSTDTGITADAENIIVDCNMKEENFLEFMDHNIVVSNIIYACDLQENISFVFDKSDYKKYQVSTYKIGIEFEKHLNINQRHKLKGILKNYLKNSKLEYQNAFSKYALKGIKNLFIISFTMILYTFFSVMGIYQYLIEHKQKTFGIYIINGMSKKQLKKMLIVENISINSLVIIISTLISIFFCRYNGYNVSGFLRFTPYLLTACIVFLASFFMSVYCCHTIYKKDSFRWKN